MNKNYKEIIKQLTKLSKTNQFNDMKNILSDNQEVLDYWYIQAQKEIFDKLNEDKLGSLFKRFNYKESELTYMLATVFTKESDSSDYIPQIKDIFQNNEFIPRSFLIASCRALSINIDDMINIDYVNLNPYLDDVANLYLDKDGIGVKLENCNYAIFNGAVPFLDKEKSYEFERLLMSSISLDKDEKLEIIRSINNLNEFQIIELMTIWDTENLQFINLNLPQHESLRVHTDKHAKWWKEIIEENKKEKRIKENLKDTQDIFDKNNDFTPKAILGYLNGSVVGQNKAKKKIATAIYQQDKLFKSDKKHIIPKNDNSYQGLKPSGPILLAGPTGSGKTFIIQEASKFSNLNFVHVDASLLVESGISGYSTDDIVKKILAQANYDLELAKYSVLFFDECDKILHKYNPQSILGQLLRFTEGAKMPINISQYDSNIEKLKKIDNLSTNNMLIIFGGAFQWLNDKEATVGFGASLIKKEEEKLSHEDIEKSGFPKELLGRIKQTIILDKLTKSDYYKILTKSKDSPLNDYIKKIEINKDKVIIESGVLEKIASMAYNSEFGIRKITHILENLFDDIMFQSPDKKIETFTIKLCDLDKI